MTVKGIPEVSDYIGYSVPTCILYFKNREQPVMTEEIRQLTIGRNYRGGEYFPDFDITFNVDRRTFFDIMREKDSLKMLLKVTYFGVAPVEGEEAVRTKERVWFNEKFVTYLDDNQYDLMISEAKVSEEVYNNMVDLEKGRDVSQHKEYTIKLNLFKESDVNAAYSIHNGVYSNTDRATLITHLLYKSGVKNVLMSPVVSGTLKEAITLPITLIGNLNYLMSQYGIHSHGSWFFFDLNEFYLLNKKAGCTAWKKGDVWKKIVFTVRDYDDSKKFMGGSRMAKDGISYVNLDSKNISISSYSSIDSVTMGGDIRSIHHANNSVKSLKTTASARKLYPKYLHNKYGNSIAEKSLIEDMNDKNKVITFRTYENNVTWMLPYKDYHFTFVNKTLEKELGGRYKMLNMFTTLTNGGEYFKQESIVQMSKA